MVFSLISKQTSGLLGQNQFHNSVGPLYQNQSYLLLLYLNFLTANNWLVQTFFLWNYSRVKMSFIEYHKYWNSIHLWPPIYEHWMIFRFLSKDIVVPLYIDSLMKKIVRKLITYWCYLIITDLYFANSLVSIMFICTFDSVADEKYPKYLE